MAVRYTTSLLSSVLVCTHALTPSNTDDTLFFAQEGIAGALCLASFIIFIVLSIEIARMTPKAVDTGVAPADVITDFRVVLFLSFFSAWQKSCDFSGLLHYF